MKKILLCLVLAIVLLNACNQHSEQQCDLLLKMANDNLYQFYVTTDTLLLVSAKNYIDSIDCNSFKYRVFNSKTTLLILLKKYSEGMEYIKSLNAADFNKPYQKNMYFKNFEALQCEVQGDTVKRNNLYMEIIDEIQSCLKNDINQEILFDLFLFKNKVETHEQILQEIELLRKTGKYENDFIDALATAMTDIDNEIKSIIVPESE